MIDPDWLFTDPVPVRTKGWSPRGRGGVKLRQEFVTPEQVGAGQEAPGFGFDPSHIDNGTQPAYAGDAASVSALPPQAAPTTPAPFETEEPVSAAPISRSGGTANTGPASSGVRSSDSPVTYSPEPASDWGPNLVPNQFGDPTLTWAEAQTACGPAAAVAFARKFGRNPTLREATDLASQRNLWGQNTGMYGPQAEVQLLQAMGVPAHLASPDEGQIQDAVRRNDPVGIDTPNHYFVIDQYDENSGLYHVGNSGTAFKAGSPWLSWRQINNLGGGTRSAIYADHTQGDSDPYPDNHPLASPRVSYPKGVTTQPSSAAQPATYRGTGGGEAASTKSPDRVAPDRSEPQRDYTTRQAKDWFTYVDDGREVMKVTWGDGSEETQVLGEAEGDPGTVVKTGTLGAGADDGTGDQTTWPIPDETNPPLTEEEQRLRREVPSIPLESSSRSAGTPSPATTTSDQETVWPVQAPGQGFDPSHMQAATQPEPGIPLKRDVRDEQQTDQPTIFDMPEPKPIELPKPDRRMITSEGVQGPDPNAGVTEIGKAAAGLPVDPMKWREDFTQAAVGNVVPEQIAHAPVLGGLIEQTFDPLFGPAGGVGGKAFEGAAGLAGKAIGAAAPAVKQAAIQAAEHVEQWFPTVAAPVSKAIEVADDKLWDPLTHAYQAAWDKLMPDNLEGNLMAGAPARAGTQLAVDVASGAASAGAMAHQTSTDDPNYWQKITLAGIGGIVAAHATPRIVPEVVHELNDLFQTTGNIADKNVRKAFAARANRMNAARGENALWTMRIEEQMGKSGKGYNNLDAMRLLEETGGFGPGQNATQAQLAQDIADYMRDTGDEGRRLKYIHGDVTTRGPGAPVVYVPRVLKSMVNAAQQAPGTWTGKLNPKDFYSHFREHLFIRDAQAAGVELEDSLSKSIGHYAEHVNASRANALFVKDLKKVAPNSVRRIRSVKNIPDGYVWGGKYLRQWQNMAFSQELDTALKNITSPGITNRAGKFALDMMGAAKNALFAPSLFHFTSEMRQVVSAAGVKGLPVLPRAMFYILPGTSGPARKFWLDPGVMADARRAMDAGLIMFRGNPEVAENQGFSGIKAKAAQAGWGAAAAGAKGYSDVANDESMNDQQRLERGLQSAGIGAAGGLVGGTLSRGLWERAVPFMKFATWKLMETHAGPEEAARYVNSVYGGQNLEAIARSRKVQDVLRLTVLAPDWQEGWIRQIGNFFKPGPVGSSLPSNIAHSLPIPGVTGRNVAELNRQYWARAAVMEGFILEGLNLALNGHFTNDNGPGHELTLETTKLYDDHGWDRTDPQTGEKYRTYEDILGPYRSMMQAPFDPGRFAAARVGLIPSEAQTAASGKDWRGQDITSPNEDPLKAAGERVAYMLARLAPVGPAELIRTVGKEPPGVAAFQSITGLRAQRMSPLQEKVQERDKAYRDHGFSVERERDFNTQYGLEVAQAARDQGAAFGRAADKTHAQIANDVQKVDWPNRQKQLEALEPAQITSDPIKHADWVTFIRSIGSIGTQSSEQPADLGPDVDLSTLQSVYWTPPGKSVEDMASLSQRGRDTVRESALVQQALQLGVDPNSVRDAIKAQEKGVPLPPLPGVSSAMLDGWLAQWRGATDDDPQVQADKRRALIDQFASEHALDPAAVYQRIKMRNTPLQLEDPDQPGISAEEKARRDLQTSYERAQDMLYASRDPQQFPRYVNPDGTSYKGSGPTQWDAFDKQVTADTKAGKSTHTPEVKALMEARDTANAKRLKSIYSSPANNDYQRWYGAGRNMTEAKWQEYVKGQGRQFVDTQDPKENRRRTRTLELWKASTPKERQTTSVKIKVAVDGQVREEVTSLEQAKRHIQRMADPGWKVDLGLDDSGTLGTQSGG